jgi:hypothetical protein
MKLFFSLFVSVLAFDTIAQTSYVPPTKILLKKGHQLGLSGDLFNTSERIDRYGNNVKFEKGESFSRIQSEVSGYFAPTENLQIGAGARYRRNESSLDVKRESGSGIESTFLNLMYAFKPVNQIYYALEASYRYRPFTNKGDESFILGDDGAEYSLGMGGTYAFKKNNFLTGKFGYRNNGSDLSDEIYWQIEGALVWKNLALVAGVDGLSSLNNDPYQDNDLDRPILNRGSTFLYNSINREFISPYAGVNFAFGQTWRIELRGSRSISGNSTDLGTDFGFSIFRRVEADLKKQSDKTFKEYDFEASIQKVSPQNGYVVIDKGLADDVQKGTQIDFFEFDFVGGNILVASGIVIQVKSDTSVVKISQVFNDKNKLKEGLVARGKYK